MGGGMEIFCCTDNESMSGEPRRGMQKFEVYREILQRLRDSENEEVSRPGFEEELCNHFNRLTSRYATDVNVKQPEDVIMHMKLLHRAGDPATRPAFEVRIVQVLVSDLNCGEFVDSNTKRNVGPQTSGGSAKLKHFFEITISMVDKPKLLSQLSSLLSDVGLNIQEAHAFSTSDGYSLDVFVVDCWSCEETEQLKHVLEREIPKIEIEDVNTPYKRIPSCRKIEQTANAVQEARARLQLLEKVYALAIQEDLAIASAATSSQQLCPEDSLLSFEGRLD